MKCKAIQCQRSAIEGHDFCPSCHANGPWGGFPVLQVAPAAPIPGKSLAEQYPQYYKAINGLTEVDVYAIHQLFEIQDFSGCIQHASKKLLLSGVRTGGKTKRKDIQEARDTLDRWLQLNPEII